MSSPDELPSDLLEKLACPRCRGPVHPAAEAAALDCRACSLRYAIEDGIPNMLVDEATQLPGNAAPETEP